MKSDKSNFHSTDFSVENLPQRVSDAKPRLILLKAKTNHRNLILTDVHACIVVVWWDHLLYITLIYVYMYHCCPLVQLWCLRHNANIIIYDHSVNFSELILGQVPWIDIFSMKIGSVIFVFSSVINCLNMPKKFHHDLNQCSTIPHRARDCNDKGVAWTNLQRKLYHVVTDLGGVSKTFTSRKSESS